MTEQEKMTFDTKDDISPADELLKLYEQSKAENWINIVDTKTGEVVSNSFDELYQEAFKIELVRELLTPLSPNVTDALIEDLLKTSSNPWDAPILYQMMKLVDPETFTSLEQ